MSHVMCHVSGFMCHLSCITCHVSFLFIFSDKVVGLVGGGSVINRANLNDSYGFDGFGH